jgi:hypothetical protein
MFLCFYVFMFFKNKPVDTLLGPVYWWTCKSEFPSFGVRFPSFNWVMTPAIFFDEPGILRRPGSSKKLHPNKLYPPLYVKALGNKNPKKNTPRPWQPPTSHGRHGDPPTVPRHTASSQHSALQVYVVQTREYYCYY